MKCGGEEMKCRKSPDGGHLWFGKPFMNKKPLKDYPSIIIDYIDVDFTQQKCAHCGKERVVR